MSSELGEIMQNTGLLNSLQTSQGERCRSEKWGRRFAKPLRGENPKPERSQSPEPKAQMHHGGEVTTDPKARRMAPWGNVLCAVKGGRYDQTPIQIYHLLDFIDAVCMQY
jgi:hypothetical protein